MRQGGCCSLCHLGACHLSLLSVLSRFLVLQTIATRLHLGMCHFATTCLHEGHKASEIGQEEEAKDASSTFYVKKHQTIWEVATLFFFFPSQNSPSGSPYWPNCAFSLTDDEDDSYAYGRGIRALSHVRMTYPAILGFRVVRVWQSFFSD